MVGHSLLGSRDGISFEDFVTDSTSAAEKRDPGKAREQLTVVGPAVADEPLSAPLVKPEPEFEHVPDGGRPSCWDLCSRCSRPRA